MGGSSLKDLADAYHQWPGFAVSISQSQRRPLPGAHWIANVPHGLSPARFEFLAQPQHDYLAFLGRIAPEKRPISRSRWRAGQGFHSSSRPRSIRRTEHYFSETIRPLLHDPHQFIGEIDEGEKSSFSECARAAFSHRLARAVRSRHDRGDGVRHAGDRWRPGSVPELIDDGVTGFIVEFGGRSTATQSPAQLTSIASKVRATFEQRFSANRWRGISACTRTCWPGAARRIADGSRRY